MTTTVNTETFIEFKNNLAMMVKQVVADFDKKKLIKVRTTINIYNNKITISFSNRVNPSQKYYIYIYSYDMSENDYPETMCEVFNKVWRFITRVC